MGRTSGIGESSDRAGFTLTEVLVVLVILGLLGSAVLVMLPDRQQSLASEAERFAARLVRAKEEAVLSNRMIEVRVTQQGYDFDTRRGAERRPLSERPFGQVEWGRDTTATLSAADGQSWIAFDSTGIATPAVIDLLRTNGQARVSVDAGGHVTIDARAR